MTFHLYCYFQLIVGLQRAFAFFPMYSDWDGCQVVYLIVTGLLQRFIIFSRRILNALPVTHLV